MQIVNIFLNIIIIIMMMMFRCFNWKRRQTDKEKDFNSVINCVFCELFNLNCHIKQFKCQSAIVVFL